MFFNPLQDNDIDAILDNYNEDETNDIFRPLTKIRSTNASYRVGYYDETNYNKVFAKQIVNKQRKGLLVAKSISIEDIGELESSIIHKRSSTDGKISKTIIQREQLKSYEFEKRTNIIELKEVPSIMLAEEILVNINFDYQNGFTFSFDDLKVDHTDKQYERGLLAFYVKIYNKIIKIREINNKTNQETEQWDIVKKLVIDTSGIK